MTVVLSLPMFGEELVQGPMPKVTTESCDALPGGDPKDFDKYVCILRAPDPDEFAGLITQIENDLWGGSDENYTSGLRALYAVPSPTEWLDADLLTISVAQLIFNPTDIYRKVPDPDDRPYAGYLHLGLALHNIDWGLRRRDSFGLDLGVVGPSSLGESAQKAYHDVKDIDPPIGWEEQIKDEPIAQLSYEIQIRPSYVDTPDRDGWGWDNLVLGAATIGNGFIYAEAGTEVRAGLNLAPRWATSLVSPGAAASSPLPWAEGIVAGKPKLSVETFAGARGRLVGRDITLDGNTFRDSNRLDKNYAVADLYAGAGWGYGWFSMTFTEAYRSPEFEGQDGGQFFGSLTVNIRF